MTRLNDAISAKIEQTPIFSTHEHHRDTEFQTKLNLDSLLANSYVNWCSAPEGSSKAERRKWLDTIRMNSYFVWLEKSVCEIYGADEINEENWEDISHAISKAHTDPEFHWRLLKEKAHYKGFVEDAYWDTGSVIGNPAFVKSAYRMDSWLAGYHPDSRDHDDNNARQFTDADLSTFDFYEDTAGAEIERRKADVVALKCASAYERTIKFDKTDRATAKKIFGKHPSVVTDEEKDAFGNYIFHHFLELARQYKLPIQLHTGLAQLGGSDPMLLEPIIASNPDLTFVLFHGGFPWIYETGALAHNYKNVVIDINWLPLISTKAAETALHTYLEILRSNHNLCWGGDTWTSEEAYGAALAFKYILGKVMSEKIDSSFYRLKDAERMVEKIMHRNAEALYSR